MMRGAHSSNRETARGQVIVLFALTLVVLVGALALILDGGRVYTERRRSQNAADAAATAGAAALDINNISGTLTAVQKAACTAAFANGFGSDATCGANGSVVDIHVPGPGGDKAGQLTGVLDQFEAPGYVQVSVRSDFRPFVATVFGFNNFSASALGVAVNIPGSGTGFGLVVLDPVDCGALQINTTGSTPTSLTVYGGVQVDSNAFHTTGSATPCSAQPAARIDGQSLLKTWNSDGTAPGPNNVVGNGDPGANPAWTTGADYVTDPLTNVHVPPFGPNDGIAPPPGAPWSQPGTADAPQLWTNSRQNPFPDGSTGVALPPGVIWGGISVGTGDTLVLQGGTYIMAGGGFNISGGQVTANNPVTIIYTTDPSCNTAAGCPPGGKKGNGDLPSSTGQQTGAQGGFWGTSASPLQAPTNNTVAPYLNKILIYVDRDVAPCAKTSGSPNGNTNLVVGGNGSFVFGIGSIIYAPCSAVSLYGGQGSYGGGVVAYMVSVSGNKTLNLGGPGVDLGGLAKTNLVQ
jgi:Flp pilus assembly protein TadG